jgi:isoquinoline 1-oxidoreductase subunit beta
MTDSLIIDLASASVQSGSANGLSRRGFLRTAAAAGGGLILSLHLPLAGRDAAAQGSEGFTPNAFIRIGTDGQVVLTMPYVEMGQGSYTSIPMLIAEELEVDLSQVRLEHAPPDEKRYGNPLLGGLQATGNSNAVRASWQPLRQAGATARTMLIAAAAQRWNADSTSCRAQNGEVVHVPTNRRFKYGDLAADAARISGPGRCVTQGANRFQGHWQAGEAVGHAHEGQRHGCLRYRCAAAWREDRDTGAIAGLRRARKERE